MALFAQYAMASTEEALEDAGWKPTTFDEREATVWSTDPILDKYRTHHSIGGLPRLRYWQFR